MNPTKDYYAVLGVLPSIEQAALIAVYRALVKKYHPDVYSGSDAERITKELNEAFGVLGTIEKRNAYDNARKSRSSSSGDYNAEQNWGATNETDIETEVNRDWEYVVRYRPALEASRQGLEGLSPQLAFAYQITVLATKSWDEANRVAEALKRQFLEGYFGTDATIHKFVLRALKEKRRDVALEVNRAIKILGTPNTDQVAEFLDAVSKTTKWEWVPSSLRARLPMALWWSGNCPDCGIYRVDDGTWCVRCGSTKPVMPR